MDPSWHGRFTKITCIPGPPGATHLPQICDFGLTESMELGSRSGEGFFETKHVGKEAVFERDLCK